MNSSGGGHLRYVFNLFTEHTARENLPPVNKQQRYFFIFPEYFVCRHAAPAYTITAITNAQNRMLLAVH